jgi:hypothetical protein
MTHVNVVSVEFPPTPVIDVKICSSFQFELHDEKLDKLKWRVRMLRGERETHLVQALITSLMWALAGLGLLAALLLLINVVTSPLYHSHPLPIRRLYGVISIGTYMCWVMIPAIYQLAKFRGGDQDLQRQLRTAEREVVAYLDKLSKGHGFC